MQVIKIKQTRKNRTIIYMCLVFFVSCILSYYFDKSFLFYLGFFLVFVSIVYEVKNKISITAIILPDEQGGSLKFIIDSNESDFWVLKKHIIINGWVYLYVTQQGSNKKLKIWLYKSDFVEQDTLRDLTRYILFALKN